MGPNGGKGGLEESRIGGLKMACFIIFDNRCSSKMIFPWGEDYYGTVVTTYIGIFAILSNLTFHSNFGFGYHSYKSIF
jgi:hypothetical protein